MEFAEKHKDQADHFRIVTIHETNRGVTNVAQLTPRLEQLEKSRWKGKKFPFPVIFDTSGTMLQSYGVSAFPTIVLIDPEGNLAVHEVGHSGQVERRLAAELAKLKHAASKPTTQPAGKPAHTGGAATPAAPASDDKKAADAPAAPKPQDPPKSERSSTELAPVRPAAGEPKSEVAPERPAPNP